MQRLGRHFTYGLDFFFLLGPFTDETFVVLYPLYEIIRFH